MTGTSKTHLDKLEHGVIFDYEASTFLTHFRNSITRPIYSTPQMWLPHTVSFHSTHTDPGGPFRMKALLIPAVHRWCLTATCPLASMAGLGAEQNLSWVYWGAIFCLLLMVRLWLEMKEETQSKQIALKCVVMHTKHSVFFFVCLHFLPGSAYMHLTESMKHNKAFH